MKHISLINGLAHVARAKAYFESANKNPNYKPNVKLLCYNTINKFDWITNEWLNNPHFPTDTLQQIRADYYPLINVERNLIIDSINEILMQLDGSALEVIEDFLKREMQAYHESKAG